MLKLFRGIKLIGLFGLKVIALSGKPIDELKEKYDDSSKPYFLGFGLATGMIYLIIKATN